MSIAPLFHSILFPAGEGSQMNEAAEPAFFRDLNLDQVVQAIVIGRREYNLEPFFYTPLQDLDSIRYRHEVFKDLESSLLLNQIKEFTQKMGRMRESLGVREKLSNEFQKQQWFLEAIHVYCQAINSLALTLSDTAIRSSGLSRFRDYLVNYRKSDCFSTLVTETRQLKADLSALKYCILIDGVTLTVRKYRGESDYSAEVERTFEKFKQGAVKDYRVKFSEWLDMNHIEAKILEFVTYLYPETFARLHTYCAKNVDYLDAMVSRFDREIQFYVAYLDHIEKFKRAGLQVCYPTQTDQLGKIYARETYDLALANKLVSRDASIVPNSFDLNGVERVFVISGPNQGGKTTFARTFGQVHYLASIGCLIPGSSAQLSVFDKIFTHFERPEDMKTLRGKLQDDLIRVREILNHATCHSIIITNEIFTSTTMRDATFLSEMVMKQILELDLLCVWVTFIDEIASLDRKIVSLVSTVAPDNPTSRTFKIVRKPADGLAYAMSIAEKYRLTNHQLAERIRT
jgi:DNA mismatch repair protein MutS